MQQAMEPRSWVLLVHKVLEKVFYHPRLQKPMGERERESVCGEGLGYVAARTK